HHHLQGDSERQGQHSGARERAEDRDQGSLRQSRRWHRQGHQGGGWGARKGVVNRGLRAALREYNAGRFFECHEALEELLDDTAAEDWNFILGLIQIAVGYHKLTAGHAGGEKLLAMGLAKLAPYDDAHGGLDVARVR